MPKLQLDLGKYGDYKDRSLEPHAHIEKMLKAFESAEIEAPKVLEWAAKTCTKIVMHNAKVILVDEIYSEHPSWKEDLTGELLRRFRSGFDVVGEFIVSAYVDNYAREATFLDRGTKAHWIEPVNARALVWKTFSTVITGGARTTRPAGNVGTMVKGRGKRSSISRSETLSAGVASDRIGHEIGGVEPHDFMARALDASMPDINLVFQEAEARLAHAINPNITAGIGMHSFPDNIDDMALYG